MAKVETVPINQLPPHMRTWLEKGVVAGVYNNNMEAMWQPGLLGPRLQELMRIRSAQINGCNNRAVAIKHDGRSGRVSRVLVNKTLYAER